MRPSAIPTNGILPRRRSRSMPVSRRPTTSKDAPRLCRNANLPFADGDEPDRALSISPCLVRFLAGLHEIEVFLDLAQHPRKILALLRRQARQDFLLLAQQARDQLLVQRLPRPRHAQLKLTAVICILDAFHELPRH